MTIFSDASRDFPELLARDAAAVAAFLEARLQGDAVAGFHAWPDKLAAAMRHGVLNGGKRLRPFLVLETARMLGGDEKAALHTAAALECIHCYSLIHDDLPAMDDDDLRRGQPTVHIAFDEATAILAGDALLTLAFELIADPAYDLDAGKRVALIRRLAQSAGACGMAGGQALDLAAETETLDEMQIAAMQAMKTGALLRFGCEAGAILSGADEATFLRLSAYGEKIGLAFQLADDILDHTASAEAMGKATQKDAQRNKKTYLALHGLEAAQRRCDELLAEACDLLAPFGDKGHPLAETARFIIRRKS